MVNPSRLGSDEEHERNRGTETVIVDCQTSFLHEMDDYALNELKSPADPLLLAVQTSRRLPPRGSSLVTNEYVRCVTLGSVS